MLVQEQMEKGKRDIVKIKWIEQEQDSQMQK